MTRVVTRSDLDLGIVTMDVPHGDLLVKAGASLARWQGEVEQLSEEMVGYQDDGVFLDEDGTPVVPGGWERKEDGHHAAWCLVWPHKYVRTTGRKRRQYVKAADYEPTRAKLERMEYANLKVGRDKLVWQIERVGKQLAKTFFWRP